MPGCCSRCGRRVYAAEERLALGRSWHLECFTCAICNRSLDSANLAECKLRDEIYCNICYRQYFGLQGYGFGSPAPTLRIHRPTKYEKLPNECPEDTPPEDATPEETFPKDPRQIPPPPSRLGSKFIPISRIPPHYQNHASLNPGDPCLPPAADRGNDDSQINSSELYEDSNSPEQSNPSTTYDTECSNDDYSNYTTPEVAEEDCRPIPKDNNRKHYSQRSPDQQNLVNNSRKGQSQSSSDGCQPISARNHPQYSYQGDRGSDEVAPKPPRPPAVSAPNAPYRTNGGQITFQQKLSAEKPSCQKCKEPVFHAEIQQGYRGAYHIDCFRCGSCSKQLSSGTVNENQGELFCKACFRRNFGNR